jgi:tetratricopeptide (TPR) repeat protein
MPSRPARSATWSVRDPRGREAGALGAYREALAHLSRAIEHSQGLPDADRAPSSSERKAFAAHFCGAFAVAPRRWRTRSPSTAGPAPWPASAAPCASPPTCTGRWRSALAEARASEAVQVLSAEPDSWQYAMALASQAQFDMLADRNAGAIPAAEEALARAEEAGTLGHLPAGARPILRTARASTDLEAGLPAIRATIAEARERGELDELPRLYTNLTSLMAAARPPRRPAGGHRRGRRRLHGARPGAAGTYLRSNRAVALLDMGRIDEAVSEAEQVVYGPYPRRPCRCRR